MTNSNFIDAQLHELAIDFLNKSSGRHVDPLKAAAVHQETAETFSAMLIRRVQAKSLFIYANQYLDQMRLQLQDNLLSQEERQLIQTKFAILETAMKEKSVDYLKELVPFSTNLAQHALFSASPKLSASNGDKKAVRGVRSVVIKNKQGEVLTTYDARVMGAIQALWSRQGMESNTIELKYSDIISEMGLSDGSTNYKRIQESLKRLMDIEVTLTQYQRKKNAEYEEIALTRLIDQIVFRRKVSITNQYQYKFEIRLPDWLVEANRAGNSFELSLVLMNDLQSFLAQGLYWLLASYPDQPEVTFELNTLAGHFHFLDNDQPVIPIYKIIDRLKQACEELKQVGFIEEFTVRGKKQGLNGRFLKVTKNPLFLSMSVADKAQATVIKQLDLFEDDANR